VSTPPEPIPTAQQAAPSRSRRAALAAGLGGVAAWVAGSFARTESADAAAGGSVRLGRSNSAGSGTTRVTSGGRSAALFGNQTASGIGVRGDSKAGTGILGTAAARDQVGVRGRNTAATLGVGAGVSAEGGRNHGLIASTTNESADAIQATNSSASGQSGAAIRATAPANTAIIATTATGNAAIEGDATGANGTGVVGNAVDGANGTGVVGNGSQSSGTGVRGSGFVGVDGASSTAGGVGVRGNGAGADSIGVAGSTSGSGQAVGVKGVASVNGLAGVLGTHLAGAGQVFGVVGQTASTGGAGVVGNATATGAANGVGVSGNSQGSGAGAAGVVGSAGLMGVKGSATSVNGVGVQGENLASTGGSGNTGVVGTVASAGAIGVKGTNPVVTGGGIGVVGNSAGATGVGVLGAGTGASGIGVQGSGVIGVSSIGTLTVAGNATVSGTVSAAAIVAGSKSFQIDHPLDPANRVLTHSCVESDERRNIYDGMAELDATGSATVGMPAWFEALNGDLRYQLTAIGAPMPDIHVTRPVKDGSFDIGGGAPGGTVSWQLTGVRRDAYAVANPLVVEEPKRDAEKGRYLHPAAFGIDLSRGIAALTVPMTSL
jgi:hypothetical protein